MIRPFRGKHPIVPPSAYVDESAQLIGDVRLGERSSVWFNSVLRGDINSITIGDDSNVQDCSVLHVQGDIPLVIGSRVTLGHNVTVHACTLEDRTLIGMGAVVLDRAIVGEGSIVAAGAVVRMGMVIPPRTLVAGVPARIVRDLDDADLDLIDQHWKNYVAYTAEYLAERTAARSAERSPERGV
jgi:carbonic anhydrase/acetyltransferase-like protein (isoleucine patch superfamily)